jgi:hypothetical protein
MEICDVTTEDFSPFLYLETNVLPFVATALYFAMPATLWRIHNLGIIEISQMHPLMSNTKAKHTSQATDMPRTMEVLFSSVLSHWSATR